MGQTTGGVLVTPAANDRSGDEADRNNPACRFTPALRERPMVFASVTLDSLGPWMSKTAGHVQHPSVAVGADAGGVERLNVNSDGVLPTADGLAIGP